MLQDHESTPALTPPFQVVWVHDTRQFVEQDDRWVAIPGSGDPRPCDRCGRLHEIHAKVTDVNGVAATVGVGCMDATTTEQRRLGSQATRDAKNAAKQAAQQAARAEFDAHVQAVQALPFPKDQVCVEVIRKPDGVQNGKEEWTVGDAFVWVYDWADREERMSVLESFWRKEHLIERVGGADALRVLERRAGTRYDG